MDITERNAADERQSLFAAIVEFSRDPIISKSLDGIVTSWNPGAEALFGYSAAEMIGHPIQRIIPANRPAEEDEILARLRNGQSIEHYDTERVTKDGRHVPVSVTISPIKDHAGGIIGAAKVVHDITRRKAVEEQFRLAVEAAPNGMILADSEGRIVLVNADAEKLFGYDRNELIGQKIEKLLPERFRTNHPMLRAGYAAKPSARPMGVGRDLYALRKDGTEVPVEIGLSPITSAEGTLILSAVVDITERKRATAAEQILIGELQHRTNNLLAVIQAIAQKSLTGSGSLDEARTALEARLQALARASRQLTKSNWGAVSLSEIVRVVLEPFSARIHIDGVDVMLGPTDAQNFSLVAHELATNAVKYGALSSAQGHVSIKWTVTGDGKKNLLKFQWHEEGGPTVGPPKRQGFGSSLLNAAFDDVRLDYAPQGLSCVLELSLRGLSAITGHADLAHPTIAAGADSESG